jgi:beta-aspartyl-peptidase (threonine type)
VAVTSAPEARPALIVHGGAWGIPETEIEDHLAGIRKGVDAGWKVLADGGSSLDAVQAAIVVLEDYPAFDAGTGSHLNQDGEVELDAGLMEGTHLHAGAVAAVKHLHNPILTARRILEGGDHILLVGQGAERYAAEKGLELCDNRSLIVPREQERYDELKSGHVVLSTSEPFRRRHFGTVGAVALDRSGAIAAGTSTGGSLFKRPGRVGDSPLVGSGYYADNESAGVSTTGWGESIIRVGLAKHAADLILTGAVAPEAATRAIRHLGEKAGGWGGLIMIDRAGWVGFAHNTPRMAFAWRTPQMTAAEARIEAG